jgi:hypothetical protein
MLITIYSRYFSSSNYAANLEISLVGLIKYTYNSILIMAALLETFMKTFLSDMWSTQIVFQARLIFV